jgi:hypothetical protein
MVPYAMPTNQPAPLPPSKAKGMLDRLSLGQFLAAISFISPSLYLMTHEKDHQDSKGADGLAGVSIQRVLPIKRIFCISSSRT